MRRRSSAPGGRGPDGRWSHSITLGLLPLGVLLLLAVAACGQATSTEPPTEQPTGIAAQPSEAIPTPTESPATGASTEPATASPTEPSPEPATPQPALTEPPITPAPDSGTAAACSGSDENRDFFASMAAAVDWTVYCPVLPDGWFVDDGRYRLAGGGWLEIGYDGPGDTRLILRQGAFCTAGDGCVPNGREVGSVAFGDRTGSLIAGDDGTWSIVVDRGANPSWLLVINGLDETAVRTIAADLHAVAG